MKTPFRTVLFSLFLALFTAPVTASAQGCIEYTGDNTLILREAGYYGQVSEVVSYFAFIAERDLYNSRGVRLQDFRAVIQQDRANLHKSGTADGYMDTSEGGTPVYMSETADSYFTTLERRTVLSTARYYQYCSDYIPNATLEQEIARGQVNAAFLRVTLFRHPSGSFAVLIAAIG